MGIPAAIAARKAATPTAGNDEAEAATAGPPKAAASTSTGAATPTAAHGRAETAAEATNEGRRAIPQHYPECPGSRRYHRLAAAAAATAGAAKYLHRLHRLLHSPEWLN